jgi:hypothetical protein
MFRKLNADSQLQIFRVLLVVCFLVFAAAVRILPHPWNFTPIGAMALFSGAKLRNKWAAFAIPLTALFLGDLFVGIYNFMIIVYLSFALSVLIGRHFRDRQTVGPLSLATLLGAVQFFLITNFAAWSFGYTYFPKSTAGLLQCYAAGISLFGNTLAGDAFYTVVLFGGFALAERVGSVLRSSNSPVAG